MSEHVVENSDGHGSARRIAELSAAGLGLAGASFAALAIWHNYGKGTQEPELEAGDIQPTLFDDPRLTEAKRALMGRVAVTIANATTLDNGIIMRSELVQSLRERPNKVQDALNYLMPTSKGRAAREVAYIDRRSIGRHAGYHVLPRLVALIQSEQSPTLNQALSELQAGNVTDS